MKQFSTYALAVAVILGSVTAAFERAQAFLLGGSGGQQSIQALAISGSSFTSGSPAGTYIGTLTTNMSPATPVFNGSYQLSTSGSNSGGVCNSTNGAGNGSFQIVSGDLETNGTPAAGTYTICIAASQSGFSIGQAFTITAGNLINAATTYCAANGGGSGTSASPWRYNCIQAAVNAANTGDTVYLAGGNWALDTGDAAPVTISKAINLVGAGSGNTFDVWGHVNNPSGIDQCPTSGTSITCVYTTGTTYTYFAAPNPAGFISFVSCTNDAVSHIFFDSSRSSDGGALFGLLNFQNCTGTVTVDDIRALANATNGTESSIWFAQGNGTTVIENSMFSEPYSGGYANAQILQMNGEGSDVTVINNVFYQGGYNPIYLSNLTYTTNQQYDYNDGMGDTGITPAYGMAGAGVGGPASGACPESGITIGQCNGDYHFSTTNNLFYAAGHFFGTGGGVNDPSTSGGLNDLNWTGNWVIAGDSEIDACEWGGCFLSPVQATAASCSGGTLTFNAANTGITAGAEFIAVDFSPQGYNNIWAAATANSSAITVTGVTCPGSATALGYLSLAGVTGMTINTMVDVNCTESAGPYGFNVTNNSLIGTTAAVLNENGGVHYGIRCRLGNPYVGNTTAIPLMVYGFNGQYNYLSSPSNQYLTNANTVGPIQQNNYCAGSGGAGTVTGCATSGFTTPPTCSFTLGLLTYDPTQETEVVPFGSVSFTAQYGAVEWLASTSPTAPLSSDSRWSSNNASFPNSAANSYVPPVELSGVSHGQTVYLWVMDSAQNISSACAALIP